MASPFNDGTEDNLQMRSLGKEELLVVMPQEDRLVRDLQMYLKADKYIRQHIAINQQESIKRILAEKREQNEQWWKELQQLVSRLLGQANRGSHGSIMSDMNTRKTGLY